MMMVESVTRAIIVWSTDGKSFARLDNFALKNCIFALSVFQISIVE